MIPPAERSSTAGSRRVIRSGSRAGEVMAVTLTSQPWRRRSRRGPPGHGLVVGSPGVRHLPLSLVSSPQPTTALLQQAVAHLAPVVPLLKELGELFTGAGHEIALVGGPVRDAFLGRTSPDLDFTTSASPSQTQRILTDWGDAHWDIGREFGTIGARRAGTTVEVTTYRADAYDGQTRKPVVAFGDNL